MRCAGLVARAGIGGARPPAAAPHDGGGGGAPPAAANAGGAAYLLVRPPLATVAPLATLAGGPFARPDGGPVGGGPMGATSSAASDSLPRSTQRPMPVL